VGVSALRIAFLGRACSSYTLKDRMATDAAVRLNRFPGVSADLVDLGACQPSDARARRTARLSEGIPAIHFLGTAGRLRSVPALTTAWRLRKTLRAGGYDCVATDGGVASVLAAAACTGLPTRHVMALHKTYETP
jgi:hypothetical protein